MARPQPLICPECKRGFNKIDIPVFEKLEFWKKLDPQNIGVVVGDYYHEECLGPIQKEVARELEEHKNEKNLL